MDLGLDFEGRSKKGQLKIFFVFCRVKKVILFL